jgi:hypothetical protein
MNQNDLLSRGTVGPSFVQSALHADTIPYDLAQGRGVNIRPMSVVRRNEERVTTKNSLCRFQPLLLQSSLCHGDLPNVDLSPIILPLLHLHRCLDALHSDCAGSEKMLLNIFVVFPLIDLQRH